MSQESASSRVVLITGAASGVGRACARQFAALGYHVVISHPPPDRHEAEATRRLLQEPPGDHLICQCDVSSDDEVVDMVGRVRAHYGRLHVVVNSAGLTYRVPPNDLDAMTEEKWDRILAVNTKGPFFVIRAAAALLREQADAAIVNVSSVAGLYGPASCLAYAASKGALNSMTRALARTMAPIRVNAVCPSAIDSRWMRQWMDEETMAHYADDFPIPRLSTPSDIADTVVYLAHSTKMTTGQLLIVDGGGRSL